MHKHRRKRRADHAKDALPLPSWEDSVLSILEGIGGALALSISIQLRYKDYHGIVNRAIKPLDYCQPWIFRRDHLAVALLKKSSFLPAGIDRRSVARKGFVTAEELCRETNLRVRGYLEQGCSDFTRSYILHARDKIAQILGPLDGSWLECCGFGPGADISNRRPRTTAYDKVSCGSVSVRAAGYLQYVPWTIQKALKITWAHKGPRVPLSGDGYVEFPLTDHNRVTFVPKNAKTDRCIAVEPQWNVYLQKGVGRHIRHRLKRFGVDLDDQAVNQALAHEGSLRGELSTLDLQSASDTLSLETVRALLPPDWFDLLYDLRSPCYKDGGKVKTYHKFSSMGNGFTFELESMIFYAIAKAISQKELVSVYGDDIIVNRSVTVEVHTALKEMGFELNTSKSYSNSEFRESCGTDFFMGEDVTPVYLKDHPYVAHTQKEAPIDSIIQFHNKVFSLAAKAHGHGFGSAGVLRVCRRYSSIVRPTNRVFGPSSLAGSFTGFRNYWSFLYPWDAREHHWGWDGHWVRSNLPIAAKFAPASFDRAIAGYFHAPFNGSIAIQRISRWTIGKVFVPTETTFKMCVV